MEREHAAVTRKTTLAALIGAALTLAACGGGGGGTTTTANDAAAVAKADAQAPGSTVANQLIAVQAAASVAATKATAAKTAADAADAQAAIATAAGTTVPAAKTASDAAAAQSAEAAAAATEAGQQAQAAQTIANNSSDATVKAQAAAAAAAKAEADAAAVRAAAAAKLAADAYAAKNLAGTLPAANGIVSEINFAVGNRLKAAAATLTAAVGETGDHTGAVAWETVAGQHIPQLLPDRNVSNWSGTGTPTYTLSVRDGATSLVAAQFAATNGFLDKGGMGPDEVGSLYTTPVGAPTTCRTPTRELIVRAFSTDEREYSVAQPVTAPPIRVPSVARLALWKEETCTGASWTGFRSGVIPFGMATGLQAGGANAGFLAVTPSAPVFKGGTSMVGMFAGGAYQAAAAGTSGVGGFVYMNVNYTDKTVVFSTHLTNIAGTETVTQNVPPTILVWDNALKMFTGIVSTPAGLSGRVSIGFYGSDGGEAAGVMQLKAAADDRYLATGFIVRNNVPSGTADRARVPCATAGSTTVIPATCP